MSARWGRLWGYSPLCEFLLSMWPPYMTLMILLHTVIFPCFYKLHKGGRCRSFECWGGGISFSPWKHPLEQLFSTPRTLDMWRCSAFELQRTWFLTSSVNDFRYSNACVGWQSYMIASILIVTNLFLILVWRLWCGILYHPLCPCVASEHHQTDTKHSLLRLIHVPVHLLSASFPYPSNKESIYWTILKES